MHPEAATGHHDRQSLADPVFLQDLRAQMLRFAILQLGDSQMAEDAVQEALVGALRNARSFRGRAALKTWVFAILKNKIADLLRQTHRQREAARLMLEEAEAEEPSGLFDEEGSWYAAERPATWGDPEKALHNRHFWRVFEACLDHLPGQQARVFMMREFVDMTSDEICAAVGISTSNLNVMLYRARLRLRECLENRWFSHDGAGSC